MSMLARDWGIAPGRLPAGRTNTILDVGDIGVGHVTLNEGDRHTGVTALLPHGGNLFREKIPAAVHVINGFGKSSGLIQVLELGTLETPIVLTNTLCVGTAFQSLVQDALEQNPEIGRSTGTVNPVVFECNDGVLNDIRDCAVTVEHVRTAIRAGRESCQPADRFETAPGSQGDAQEVPQGAVGAGRGMCCYDLKGGIGTSSRQIKEYTLGTLVLTNFGSLKDLRIEGQPVGEALLGFEEISRSIASASAQRNPGEQGSVIVLLATDAPLSTRQLGRLARRASAGLARTGAFIAGGSGEIALAFSTAYRLPHYGTQAVMELPCLHEDMLDKFFLGAVESIEEAVLNSMIAAERVEGRAGHVRCSLADYLGRLGYQARA
ncbi:MAG: P1 family peptidase [bacterium]